jgi:tetratricopeptide (TPR) repeat protein/4-amino-4-deoxy-L-arabinose transferase-like glycosyltransferase
MLVACALFLAVGIVRMNDTSVYTPDSCRYVILGTSLAHGQGWVDATKPVPERFMINPPLYSLLLVPAELLFPMSLAAAKVWTLCWGAAALALFYIFVRRLLGETAAGIAAFLFAFNPLFVIFSGEALSDAPFLFFLILALVLSESEESEPWKRKIYYAALVVCTSALPLLREAGVAGVIAAALVLANRRKWGFAGAVVTTAAGLMALWYWRNQSVLSPEYGHELTNPGILFRHFFTPRDAPLVQEFALRIKASAAEYAPQLGMALFGPLRAGQLSDLIVNPAAAYQWAARAVDLAKPALVVFTFAAALKGIVRDLRTSRGAGARVLFILSYLSIILIFPAHDIRYLLPLLPLLLYYALLAFRGVLAGSAGRKRAAVATAAILMLPNLLGLGENMSLNIAYNRSPESVLRYPTLPAAFRYQWKRIGSWIRETLPPDAIIASPEKDLVLVAGGRKVLEMDPAVTLPEFEAILRNDRVEYLFTPAQWKDLRAYEFPMRESRRFWFEPVAEVPNLMRVHSRLIEPIVRTPPHESFDTLSPTELLRKGRGELVRGEYGPALEDLNRALQISPNQTDVVYQAMIASMFAGDTLRAAGLYRKILALPQTYSFIEAGRYQWDAVELLAQGRSSASPEERSSRLFDAASLYWKLGYPRRSVEVIGELLRADTLYSLGLLWGFDYTLQAGDTLLARRYFSRLEGIDRSNPIVRAFSRILAAGDSINASADPAAKARLHLTLAGVYARIELGDEAFDEAERSLGADPRSADAMILLGDMLRTRGHLLAAGSYYAQALAAEPANALAIARADSIRRKESSQ